MEIEQVWPEWKTERIIGKGSYGTVYKCVSTLNGSDRRYSAIKVISVPHDEYEYSIVNSEGMSKEESKSYFRDIVNDFLNEVNLLESLKGSKNIVGIQESKVIERSSGIGWDIFIRMELLTDFNAYSSDKKFNEADVIKIAMDLSSALSVCAQRKIIHRDIKPENIFIDREGNYKLGDFGVAKQLEKTEASMSRKGTYNYMAPEVLSAKRYDSRADIYSLGIVMYKILNKNRLPFIDPDKQLVRYGERQQAFERRMNGEQIPPIPFVSDRMNWLILKACSFNPEDRFKNIGEFRYALKLFADDMAESSGNSKKTKVEKNGTGFALNPDFYANGEDKPNGNEPTKNDPTIVWNGKKTREDTGGREYYRDTDNQNNQQNRFDEKSNKIIKTVLISFIALCALLILFVIIWAVADAAGVNFLMMDLCEYNDALEKINNISEVCL